MSTAIRIVVGATVVEASLNDSATAREVAASLPITSTVSTWGEEIYFPIPVTAEAAPDAREDVTVGEIGYWPAGKAFCVFFGRTPASTTDAPRAASPVNPIGRATGDPASLSALSAVRDGDTVTIQAA